MCGKLRSLQNECLDVLARFIERNEKEDRNIEAITTYVQEKLPNPLLEKLCSWMMLRTRGWISTNKIAICFYPQKRELCFKKCGTLFNMEQFLRHSGQKLLNLTKLETSRYYSTRTYLKICSLAPNLRILRLSKTIILDCLEVVSSLSLTELDLSKTMLTGDELKLLFKNPNTIQKSLRVLSVEKTCLSIQDHVDVIKYFLNLEELNMDYSTYSLLSAMVVRPKLLLNNFITLFGDNVTIERMLYCFDSLATVKKVNLYLGYTKCNDSGSILPFLNNVEHLALSIDGTNFEFGLDILNHCSRKLKYLKLGYLTIDRWRANIFDKARLNFPKLEYLKLDFPHKKIPSYIFTSFLLAAQNLVQLKIVFYLTNDILFKTFTNSNLKHLKRLNLHRCNIDTDGILFLIDKVSLDSLIISYSYVLINVKAINAKLNKNDNDWIIVKSDYSDLWIEKI